MYLCSYVKKEKSSYVNYVVYARHHNRNMADGTAEQVEDDAYGIRRGVGHLYDHRAAGGR
jgi:hypothetical protein